MTSTPKISLRGVKKSFGKKNVLNGLDLDVGTGQSVVVIGGSGTGKSVMLKCILGLLEPDAGEILVDGQSIVGMPYGVRKKALSRFGMLFQGGALFDSMTVLENVAFSLIEAQGLRRDDAHEIAINKLGRVGLGPDVGKLMPSELSGGMQKRVGLARAIATEPEIIFFDEPTTGLDPIMADVINELIVECVRDLGATTITITHDMSSVRKIADVAAMLHNGRIIWCGPRANIDNSDNKYVDQFINGLAKGPIVMELLKR